MRLSWWPHHEHPRHCQDICARLDAIDSKLEIILSALTDLQAADAALQQEVATFLSDIAARLANSPDPAAVEAVVNDINAQVTALQGGDPANAAPPASS